LVLLPVALELALPHSRALSLSPSSSVVVALVLALPALSSLSA
jgi:hypothetical protein